MSFVDFISHAAAIQLPYMLLLRRASCDRSKVYLTQTLLLADFIYVLWFSCNAYEKVRVL